MSKPFTQQDRALIDAILDQIIPANRARGIPAAGDFGVADFIAARMADDPAVAASVARILAPVRHMTETVTTATAQRLEETEPAAFETLVRLTYLGYYSRPEIRPFFGVASSPVHPDGYEVAGEPDALLDELTAPVIARGPIYRQTSGGSEWTP